MKISLFFRWYDLWIGAYIDRANSAVYICPIPMFGVKISRKVSGTKPKPEQVWINCGACVGENCPYCDGEAGWWADPEPGPIPTRTNMYGRCGPQTLTGQYRLGVSVRLCDRCEESNNTDGCGTLIVLYTVEGA